MMTSLKLKTGLCAILLIVGSAMSCQSNSKGSNSIEEPTTTIHEAVFMNNIEEVEAHIHAGTDLNEKDEYGSTPLNIAATFNRIEAAELMIEAGADLSITSPDGSTALQTAAFLCRTEIVEDLLENGADPNTTNNFGATPLMSVQAPFQQVRPIYEQMNKDLGVLGLKLDYDLIEKERPVVADLLIEYLSSN